MRSLVRSAARSVPGARRLYHRVRLWREGRAFTTSQDVWESRYRPGGTERVGETRG